VVLVFTHGSRCALPAGKIGQPKGGLTHALDGRKLPSGRDRGEDSLTARTRLRRCKEPHRPT
jgi:hypothetical protein